MAEWKTQVTYSYNPSYQTYYGVLYQPMAGQNHLPAWSDSGLTDLSSYNGGATQSVTTDINTTMTGEESPPRSPESRNCYPGTELSYLHDSHEGQLTLAAPPAEIYGGAGEVRRARSDSISDSEAHTSPDSWSSVSSREGSLPHVDPTTWVERGVCEEPLIRSPGGSEDVSSSLVNSPQNLVAQENEANNSPIHAQAAFPAPKKNCTATSTNPKAKVRSAFSESQMNALVQRFSVQRYLTPAEMKNLAEMTGLTYKQVKTWFQNRRMKLRRHQKDTSWVSERYSIRKENSYHRPVFSNMASHIPPYQADGHPQFRGHYNQHIMEATFKKTSQNLAYYLAAGSARYPPWPTNASQAVMPNRPHPAGWAVPQGGVSFDYNPCANNYVHATTAESKDREPVSSSMNTAMVHDRNQ
ncbi:homeobox protein NANOG [Cyprinodon tularosa]|uniref:homeobox protein NANOG n=1 Tax=Cyprinodon tularosa TaxID=77115 RepID=UPI0018E24CF5|nr:homeobox protein NANOG [Cyprinodon tularosa]XP_038161632.1 homeobox protein NANOG [Cyprinodon tularosa]